ncbi:MAG: J domain-containing protein [Desulfuromonadales bacterium]|nr:J domain-containing protein [Desulfuromonadales bacterium]
MYYRELQAALEIFGLGERASLQQLKERHRELVKQFHPDSSQEEDPESIRKINAAYELLAAYCHDYRYCFSEEEFLEQVPEERLRRQFDWDKSH